MAIKTFLPFFLSIFYIISTAKSSGATTFIESSCSTTRYPTMCVRSLKAYAIAIQQSPHQLAHTALSVGLSKAETTKSFMLKLTNLRGLKANTYAALKDCLDQMDETVDRISQTVRELGHLVRAQGGDDSQWHIRNMVTWVSAALNFENTCVNGLSSQVLDDKIKSSILSQVTNTAQLTTNALALVHRLAVGQSSTISGDV